MEAVSYSDVVMTHFWSPYNHRVMSDADICVVSGVPGNGPFMVLYLKIWGDRVSETTFQTHGCAPSIAAGSLLCRQLQGATRDEAAAWTERRINEALGGLPDHKRHCSALAAGAVAMLVNRWKEWRADSARSCAVYEAKSHDGVDH
jgi:nitrogen fixation NifU-like protein